MKKLKNYNDQEIAEINFLDVLDKKEEFSKKGINFNELFSKFKFDKNVKLYNIPSDIEKKGWVKREVMELKITKKGRKALNKFFGDADKQSRKKFFPQRPIEYQLAYKLNVIEILLGFFFLSALFFSILLSMFYFGLTIKGVFFWIFVIVFIFFIFSLMFFSVAMWTIISRAISLLIRPLSFEISFFLEEHSNSVGKVITGIFFMGLIIFAWWRIGIWGLLAGLAIGILIFIIINPSWITKKINKKFGKKNKK